MIALVWDTETTGLVENRVLKLDKQPEVIEFYGCLANLDTGEILKELDVLIRPKGRIPIKITQITKLREEDLVDQKMFPDLADELFCFLESAPVVIAHNLAFDKDMMEIEAERLGRTIKWPPGLCTIEQTIGMRGYRLTLSDLHELLFGEKFAGAHRARVDVAALLRICVELRKRKML